MASGCKSSTLLKSIAVLVYDNYMALKITVITNDQNNVTLLMLLHIFEGAKISKFIVSIKAKIS